MLGTTRHCNRLPLRSGRTSLHARAALTLEAKPAKEAAEVPAALRDAVVTLEAPNAAGSTTRVHLLGVSLVSKLQAEQVKQLIRAVRPEVVMVELCRERAGLLVDDRVETQPTTNLWHCRKVFIEGVPADPAWPTAAELKQLLVTKSGRPVTTQDIEADVFTLLSTGLFRSARPGAQTAAPDEAPEFCMQLNELGAVQVQTVPPLGGVKFTVQERDLPPFTQFLVRIDSSLQGRGIDEAKMAAVGELGISEVKGGTQPLLALLKARRRFAEVAGFPVSVAFSGCETGRVEAVIKAVKASDRPYLSGLEGSAVGGEGWGIDPFRPSRPLHKLSERMFLASPTLEVLQAQVKGAKAAAAKAAAAAAPGLAAAMDVQPRSQFRVWSDEEVAAAKRAGPERVPIADAFGTLMTLLFAKYQTEACRKVGVEEGEILLAPKGSLPPYRPPGHPPQVGVDRGAVWQAALQAASEVGAQQLVLADRPAAVTDRRFADSLLVGAGTRIVGAAVIIISTIVASLVTDAPLQLEASAVATSLLTSLALLLPVIKPILEIKQLAGMDPEAIEAAVDTKAARIAGKVFGEDALLDWPGAVGPLLEERDEFMARAAAAAATGLEQGVCPAYVLDRVEGQLVWRLMQAQGSPAETCPTGFADGAYKPLADVRDIVQVVGAAHVQGIVQRWGQAVQAPLEVSSLLRDPSSSSNNSN